MHLGIDLPKPGGRGGDERYTLALGVRAAGEPDVAPPRKQAKQFLELALQGPRVSFDFASLDRKLPVTAASAVRGYAVTLDKDGKTYALAAPEAGGAIGHAVLVETLLANKGRTDVGLTAVLSNTVVSDIFGQVWPEDAKGRSWYGGYHRAIGAYQRPPQREEAALLLIEGKPQTLVAPGAGFNFGLVGVVQDLTLKAGQSVSVPLLLISIDRPAGGPDITLAAALESLKGALLGRDH